MLGGLRMIRLVLIAALSNAAMAGELEQAAINGDLETVKAAIIASGGQDHMDLLFEASRYGHVEMVRFLLEHGANPNMTTYSQFTPLHLAKEPDVVEELLKYHPDLSWRDDAFGQTVLERAASQVAAGGDDIEKWKKIVKQLRSAGADYTINSAIYLDDVNRVRELLKKRPALAGVSEEHARPLWVAAVTGREAIVKLLLDRDVNPDWGYGPGDDPDDFMFRPGWPILIDAIEHADVVKLLIDAGADIKSPVTWQAGRSGIWIIGDKATPLHHAAAAGAVESAKLLFTAGVPLDAKDDRGQTALHVAVHFDQPEVVRFLLERGADPTLKNLEGQTPLDVAESKGIEDAVRALPGNFADFFAENPPPVLREVRTLLRQARGPVEAVIPQHH